jgi:class 3 adenylate cyclase
MAASDAEPMPEVVTEAIVVIDLVESTLTSNLFGWYAVGRQVIRDLRALIGEVGESRGLRCLRSTGDGYLLTFHDPQSAERAALRAVEAVFELLNRVAHRNREVPEERALNLRCAIHLGEVDISEEVAGILSRRASRWEMVSIGLLKLKGFPGWREVFRVLPEDHPADLGRGMRVS